MNDYIPSQNGNSRIQCHKCGKWRRHYLKNGEETIFGGDSTCGRICKYCIADFYPETTAENLAICEKCEKKKESNENN